MIELVPLKKATDKNVSIPGSKSYTLRALVIAALTKGTVIIKNPLLSDDTKTMITCLKALGINIVIKKREIIVPDDISKIADKNHTLNANLSGVTIKTLLAISTIIPGTKILLGDEALNKRPIGLLVNALRSMGAEIKYLKQKNFPPLQINSSKLTKNNVALKGGISSQYFSALMLISPIIGGLQIKVLGKQISKPYIDMTIDTMEVFGVKVINENYEKYLIPGKQLYKSVNYYVEGDFSSAGYFLAIAALTKSALTLKNLNPKSKQADIKFLDILVKMGNKILYGNNEITIRGTGIKALDVDVSDFPDQAQTLAVLSAFASGTTHISGVKSLRIKETERVKALQQELKKMGIKTKSAKNSLTIFGGNPKSATIDTYDDHRMAMSFAVAGAKIAGMKINNPEVVSKTFPNFWKELEKLGVKIKWQ